ncbi:MAG: tRNA (5-methylaminomethyl-2-thiouridine)(34)-methyltransferase MnmD [Bacteroidota bacterium]
MERKIITTADGSTTIQLEGWNEQYHSKHGAIQEAYHVFLKQGLFTLKPSKISILEMGFGTGLNALITYSEARKRTLFIDYTGVEAFPVSKNELSQLNYVTELGEPQLKSVFQRFHGSPWGEEYVLSPFFTLQKLKIDFFQVVEMDRFHVIYFDAFGPRVQPELWTMELFQKMYVALKRKGVLVTYSAKGSVRRNLQNVGFTVERLPGPPGKREMLRAFKP